MLQAMDRPPSSVRTLLHMLAYAVEHNPQGEALVILGGARLTFTDLAASVLEFSVRLSELGGSSDRVAVALPNSADAVIAILGALHCRAQVVLLNPFYPARELASILADADPFILVCSDTLFAQHSKAITPSIRGSSIVLDAPYGSLVRRSALIDPTALSTPAPNDLAILQYTGGTTGTAKGVNLLHRTSALNVVQREALLPTRFGKERFLCMTPLFHSYATATSFFPALLSGSTLVVMPRYDAADALNTITLEQITLFCGTPTIYNGLIAHPSFTRTNYSLLSGAYSGAAPLTLATLGEWERVTNVPIAEGYGLTEATAILSFNPLNGRRKAGSVGLPLPGTTIEVVDPESGSTVLEPGKLGEIRASGPQLMAGYRGRPKETSEVIRNGWLYTGDIGEIDHDGYVFVRSRKKDMAIVSGYNVYPREVDEVLSSHPAVMEAVSAAVPDDYKGEIMQACVKLVHGHDCGEQELIDFCKINLARYKVPAKIFFVEQVFKTAAGKIDRKRTKEWLLEQADTPATP